MKPETPFHPMFRIGTARESRQFMVSGLNTRPLTMQEVLVGGGSGSGTGISSHFIGALLNINAGLIPQTVMDSTKLFQIWIEWSRTGRYVPAANAAPWDALAIVQYLKASGIAP